jgi:hypothetical protein
VMRGDDYYDDIIDIYDYNNDDDVDDNDKM